MSHPLFERHKALLDQALAAIAGRGYWSAFPESPSPRVYGEGAAEAGKAAFDALLNKPFPLTLPGAAGSVGGEVSPYGMQLGVTYPKVDIDALFAAVEKAEAAWRKAGPEAWVGVSLEILTRINKRSFEIAHAVMHTTGQAFVMSFQAGCPHAQDRALEAIAYAWDQLSRIPSKAFWEKPQGKNEPLKMEKHYRVVPRGVALVIGCNTFPTWNGYPGMFASLATGNAVVVKVAHDAGDDTAQKLALRPEVRIIDFTGSTANGEWLEKNARQAQVYTEKAGVNQIVVDSVEDMKSVARNVAFSLALYTGQMCTAPQNIYVPRGGIEAAEGHLSFDQVAQAIAEGVQKLVGDPARAVEILGAVVNDGVAQRIDAARALGPIVLDSQTIAHPQYPKARVRTPLIVKLDAKDDSKYLKEWFGPIAFVIATDSTAHSLDIARSAVVKHGALTLSVYSTDPKIIESAIAVAEDSGVALSINLTGGVFVNQSAAFSDFHGTGAIPLRTRH